MLPLKGKILNVERKDDKALYSNKEIASLIVALGLGLKGEANVNLRYGKVGGHFRVRVRVRVRVWIWVWVRVWFWVIVQGRDLSQCGQGRELLGLEPEGEANVKLRQGKVCVPGLVKFVVAQ